MNMGSTTHTALNRALWLYVARSICLRVSTQSLPSNIMHTRAYTEPYASLSLIAYIGSTTLPTIIYSQPDKALYTTVCGILSSHIATHPACGVRGVNYI